MYSPILFQSLATSAGVLSLPRLVLEPMLIAFAEQAGIPSVARERHVPMPMRLDSASCPGREARSKSARSVLIANSLTFMCVALLSSP